MSFSQTIYPKITRDSLIVITPEQLVKTNLIFLEHDKFKKEIVEFNKQISSYKSIVKLYESKDIARQLQLDSLLNTYKESQKIISYKNTTIKSCEKKLRNWKVAGVCGISFSVCLLVILSTVN